MQPRLAVPDELCSTKTDVDGHKSDGWGPNSTVSKIRLHHLQGNVRQKAGMGQILLQRQTKKWDGEARAAACREVIEISNFLPTQSDL